MKIDLSETELVGRSFDRIDRHRDNDDWLIAWLKLDAFHAACAPLNLSEAVQASLTWAVAE